jgi:hypothetical protein
MVPGIKYIEMNISHAQKTKSQKQTASKQIVEYTEEGIIFTYASSKVLNKKLNMEIRA